MVLAHFWKTINVHYAGGLRILADGNRMAVKEERALADGILTPFCVFLFGGGGELQDSAIMLLTFKVLIHFIKSPLIIFRRISQRRNQAENGERTTGKIPLTRTTINSPSCRITLPELGAC